MNVRHLVPSVSRRLLSMGCLMLTAGLHASGADLSKFRRIEPQYIAALGDTAATSGNGAQSWGFWNQDPGPRACKLDHYPQLKATGVAPAQWKFDASDWWLEEHGLIMEKPTFPLPAGKYLVTGDRKVTTVLTVHPKDKNGNQRWELADGATLYDVTHLVCRLLLEKKKRTCCPCTERARSSHSSRRTASWRPWPWPIRCPSRAHRWACWPGSRRSRGVRSRGSLQRSRAGCGQSQSACARR